LPVEKILFYYRLRWEHETSFRDSKQSFGFDDHQVKSETNINRFVQVERFTAMSVMQLFFNQ
ncbi:MAG: transposase, partial [bacterium]